MTATITITTAAAQQRQQELKEQRQRLARLLEEWTLERPGGLP